MDFLNYKNKIIILCICALLNISIFFYIEQFSQTIKDKETVLFFCYGLTLLVCFFNAKKYPISLLVIMLFGLFIYSRFILDLFDLLPYNIRLATRFLGYYFSESTILETLEVYIISVLGYFSGIFIFFILKKNDQIANDKVSNNPFFYKIGFYLVLISLPGVIYKLLYTLNLVHQHGYLILYSMPNPTGFVRFLEFFSYKIFFFGLCLVLSSGVSKRKFYIYASFLLLISFVYLIMGKRIEFGVAVVFIFWFWFSFYGNNRKFKIKGVLIGILSILILAIIFQNINNLREENHSDDKPSLSLVDFITQQGVSGVVMPYFLDFREYMNEKNYPYLLAPIVDRAERGVGSSILQIQNTNYFAHLLTYSISPEKFLAGEGVGACFICELYQYNYTSVYFGMIFISILLLFFDYMKYFPYFKFLSYYALATFLFLPRGELFEYFYEMVFLSMIWFGLKIFNNSGRYYEQSKN